MKSVLTALGVFALAFYISSIAANEVDTRSPTNLLDLPTELRLTIFEYLETKSLVNVHKLLPHDRNLIERVFRNVFTHHPFCMNFEMNYLKISIGAASFLFRDIPIDGSDEIDIGEMSEFLKNFGHCINKFIFKSDTHGRDQFLEPLLKPIQQYVNKFVNEVVFQYRRKDLNGLSLDKLNFTFPNAKVVELPDGVDDVTTLQQMFPMMQSLDLGLFGQSPSLPHLPNLERLMVPRQWAFERFDLSIFNQTLTLNPQLRHLRVSACENWKLVEMLNEIRPDIESLEIHEPEVYNIDTVPIRFENMKVFKWVQLPFDETAWTPFKFGNLEEIEFWLRELTGYWINVLMQNKKLRKVDAYVVLEREHLQQIADELPNLEEFVTQFRYKNCEPVQDIVDFMRRTNRLKKATFLRLNSDKCDEAAEQLKNEWENTENYRLTCRFVRKGF